MPAGDLLTNDYQLELRGLLMGYGTDYQIGEGGIRGLGSPGAKVRQVNLEGGDGSYAATDLLTEIVLTVPLVILGDDAADAVDLFDALNVAWAPGGDVELHGQLPGWGHWSIEGRSRPVPGDADLSRLKQGVIEVLYEFHALDPNTFATGL